MFRAMQHEEKVFKDPEEYRPERYLKDGQLDLSVRQPEVSAFGFGRRYQSIS
jgi:cytochrome P450